MEQAKQGGNETAPETAGYYRGAGCFSLKAAELNELLGVGRCFDMTGRDLSIGGMCPPAMRRPSRTVTRR